MPPEAAGPHSPPYSFWFNADKALLPFVLIIIIPQLFVTAPLRRSPVCTGCYWLSPYLHYCYWQPLLADWGLNRICRAGCRRLCWRICFCLPRRGSAVRVLFSRCFPVSAALCRAVYCSRCLRPGTYCRRAAAGCLCRSGRGYLRAGLDVERAAVGDDRVSLRTEPLPSAVFTRPFKVA